MIRIIITFGNQIFLQLIQLQILEKWSKFQKIWVCKKLDKRWELFSPNTDNFLAFFIVFEWAEILESAMDNFAWNCQFFEDCRRNTTASMETFTEK